MIFAFLTARGLFGLAKGWWLLIGLAAVAALLWWLSAAEKADDRANREIGASVQREADLRETLSNVEKANEAAEAVRRNSDAARAECLRNARNPDDC